MSRVKSHLAKLTKQSALLATAASVSGVSAAKADLIVFDIEETASLNGPKVRLDFDPDRKGGDFQFNVFAPKKKLGGEFFVSDEEVAIVRGSPSKAGDGDFDGPIRTLSTKDMGDKPNLGFVKMDIFSEGSFRGEGPRLMERPPFATRFKVGETVGDSDGETSPIARLYDDRGDQPVDMEDSDVDRIALSFIDDEDAFGPFAEPNDTGYIGFRLQVGELPDDEDKLSISRIALIGDDDGLGSLELGEGVYFGWAEITRGSIQVGRVGIQTDPGVGALITPRDPIDIPEPASLPLMALGAAGLFALRRQQAA